MPVLGHQISRSLEIKLKIRPITLKSTDCNRQCEVDPPIMLRGREYSRQHHIKYKSYQKAYHDQKLAIKTVLSIHLRDELFYVKRGDRAYRTNKNALEKSTDKNPVKGFSLDK